MTAYFDSAAERLQRLKSVPDTDQPSQLRELESEVVEECAVCLELLRLLRPGDAEALEPFLRRFDVLVIDGALYTRPFIAPELPFISLKDNRQRVYSLIQELHTLWHDLKHAGLAADDPRVPRGTLRTWSEERQDRIIGARFDDPDLQHALAAIERGERPYSELQP